MGRLLDIDDVIKAVDKHTQDRAGFSELDDDITCILEEVPSAQPEIIHCRDCKYWQDQEEGVVEVPICARPENKYEKFPLVMLIGGDGFCSYAERRANEAPDKP